jgi:aquaporin Z
MFKQLFSEFLGTAILVFCGTSAIVINDISQGVVSHVGIALVFGLIVLAVIYTLGIFQAPTSTPPSPLPFGKQVNSQAIKSSPILFVKSTVLF